MGKRLILLRHGKSDWQAAYRKDHDRPLAKRGIQAAKTMGQLLARADQSPDLVITSSAVRAFRTVELASQAGNWGCEIQVTDTLYAADSTVILLLLKSIPGTVKTLLLAGHEPTCSELVARLGGGQVRFPTAAMARLDFAIDQWDQVQPGQGQLVWLLQPKFFRAGPTGN